MSNNSSHLQTLYNSLTAISGITTYMFPIIDNVDISLPALELNVTGAIDKTESLNYSTGESEYNQLKVTITILLEVDKNSVTADKLAKDKLLFTWIDTILEETGITKQGDTLISSGIIHKSSQAIRIARINGIY